MGTGRAGAGGNGYVPKRDLGVGPCLREVWGQGTDVSFSRQRERAAGTRRGANQGRSQSQETGARTMWQVQLASGHQPGLRVDFLPSSSCSGLRMAAARPK